MDSSDPIISTMKIQSRLNKWKLALPEEVRDLLVIPQVQVELKSGTNS